ncbi:vWA domain-containing protein [Nannocystis bainbridge]|uniref:VWA domain-containing protein n=1 Tax=Nannocystis bainbridge TaxID=2995303 RepID=A0ABT5DQS8_9BACT|nr:vWA domain-containing protein [Nannocystis bainbridge]MDC0715954.1 VWA domain-containing protein [Nannocystis bainbridge]
MTSLGLVVGCGDDGDATSQTGAASQGTMSTLVTTVDTVATMDGTESATGTPPTTTEGTMGATSDSSGVPTSTSESTSTGMVTATMGSTETVTDTLATDPSETATSSTSDSDSDTSTTVDTTSTTSTTDTTTTTTGDPGTTTEDTPCNEMQVTLTPVVPNVMLVLDKSGSMLSLWDHDANANTPTVSRWYSLYAVVDQVLTNFNAKFNFGMNLFPNKQAVDTYVVGACPVNGNVEVPVAPFNKNPILNALPAQNNNTIKGGTPAQAGVLAALTHLKTLDPMVPRAIMLITDGAANCTTGLQPPPLFENYDQSLHTLVGNAWTQDTIPTYVIGIAIANSVSPVQMDGSPDSTNPYVKLNELATQGGTAKPGPEKFYSADNQVELQAALNAIVTDAQSCVIALNDEPGFPQFTKVKIGDVEVPKINNCANENGWKYTDPAPPYVAIELCGTACNSLKQTGEAGVEYYCKPA